MGGYRLKGKVFEVTGREWTIQLGRLEIHRTTHVLWRCLKSRHWLPANYSAESHHQVRWLWWIITLFKKKWWNRNE